MPIRARRFVPFAKGTITDNPLSNSATTVNSAEFASLPIIGTAGFVWITLDPGGANERVPVLAHTAAATSVTVERISGVSHAAGTDWVAGVYSEDLPESVDLPWADTSKLIFAEEFEGEESTSLPTGASWVNQGGSAFARRFGHGILTIPTSSGSLQVRGIDWALPSNPTSWVLMAKMSGLAAEANFFNVGIGLREASSGKLWTVGYNWTSSGLQVASRPYTNVTTETTPSNSHFFAGRPHAGYLGIRKNSASSFDMFFSLGGAALFVVHAAQNIASHMSGYDRIFMGGDNRKAGDYVLSCDWIRLWDLT